MGMANVGMVMRARGDAAPIGTAWEWRGVGAGGSGGLGALAIQRDSCQCLSGLFRACSTWRCRRSFVSCSRSPKSQYSHRRNQGCHIIYNRLSGSTVLVRRGQGSFFFSQQGAFCVFFVLVSYRPLARFPKARKPWAPHIAAKKPHEYADG